MARTFDEPFGGPGIANLDLINNIIELDPEINYVLFYKSKNHLGRYKDFFPRRDRKELEAIKQKYNLPENFILSVAKPFQGDRLLHLYLQIIATLRVSVFHWWKQWHVAVP